MANKTNKIVTTFRQKFEVSKKNVTNWFPGHMARGVKNMQRMLKKVDCIIEVHDARIPFSGRNPNFYSLLTAARPHILVLNKMDLADLKQKAVIRNLLEQQNDDNVLFTNAKDSQCRGIRKILPMVTDLIKSGERFNRSEAAESNVMIIGVPNVGKSSLINSLRHLHLKKGNATRVGASPGITKSVLEKIKISDDPLIYLFDTPGIMQPNIRNADVGLKLAVCAAIQDAVIDIITIADYLLYWMNKHGHFRYVDVFGLENPLDDAYLVLLHVAMKSSLHKKIRSPEGSYVIQPDIDSAAKRFVKAFQEGQFGRIMLDDDFIKENC